MAYNTLMELLMGYDDPLQQSPTPTPTRIKRGDIKPGQKVNALYGRPGEEIDENEWMRTHPELQQILDKGGTLSYPRHADPTQLGDPALRPRLTPTPTPQPSTLQKALTQTPAPAPEQSIGARLKEIFFPMNMPKGLPPQDMTFFGKSMTGGPGKALLSATPTPTPRPQIGAGSGQGSPSLESPILAGSQGRMNEAGGQQPASTIAVGHQQPGGPPPAARPAPTGRGKAPARTPPKGGLGKVVAPVAGDVNFVEEAGREPGQNFVEELRTTGDIAAPKTPLQELLTPSQRTMLIPDPRNPGGAFVPIPVRGPGDTAPTGPTPEGLPSATGAPTRPRRVGEDPTDPARVQQILEMMSPGAERNRYYNAESQYKHEHEMAHPDEKHKGWKGRILHGLLLAGLGMQQNAKPNAQGHYDLGSMLGGAAAGAALGSIKPKYADEAYNRMLIHPEAERQREKQLIQEKIEFEKQERGLKIQDMEGALTGRRQQQEQHAAEEKRKAEKHAIETDPAYLERKKRLDEAQIASVGANTEGDKARTDQIRQQIDWVKKHGREMTNGWWQLPNGDKINLGDAERTLSPSTISSNNRALNYSPEVVAKQKSENPDQGEMLDMMKKARPEGQVQTWLEREQAAADPKNAPVEKGGKKQIQVGAPGNWVPIELITQAKDELEKLRKEIKTALYQKYLNDERIKATDTTRQQYEQQGKGGSKGGQVYRDDSTLKF